jgi:hypothetical protein
MIAMSNPYDPNANPYPQAAQQPAPYQPYQPALPEHPQGTTILVLGIVGLFFTICAPIAWYMGSKALKEIKASGVKYGNEQQIVIGRILGMVLTIVGLVALVFGLVFAGIVFLGVLSQAGS